MLGWRILKIIAISTCSRGQSEVTTGLERELVSQLVPLLTRAHPGLSDLNLLPVMSSPKKRILFVHPDLGIGGAERLVVDAAVGLQERGHSVTIYTSHCDPQHCFDEARDGRTSTGTGSPLPSSLPLFLPAVRPSRPVAMAYSSGTAGTLAVRVAGNTIVPPSILGRFSILCATLRQLHLALSLLSSGELADYDCLFLDQLSACLPLFRLFAPHMAVLFYCHFPDYLLAPRQSLVRSLYRIPFDWLEACTTGLADTIAVNSRFTRSVFATAFPRIRRQPRVVYPCVDVPQQSQSQKGLAAGDNREPELLASDGRKILLSINRFERKKNIGLAIRALAQLSAREKTAARLIVAGTDAHLAWRPYAVPYVCCVQAATTLGWPRTSRTTTSWARCATASA